MGISFSRVLKVEIMTQIRQKALNKKPFTPLRRVLYRGQGLVEYGLILGVIAVSSIAALMMLGSNSSAMLGTMRNLISGNQASSPVAQATPSSGTKPTPSTPVSTTGNTTPTPPTTTPHPTSVTQPQTTCFAGSSWCIDMSGGQNAVINVAGANGMTQHVYAMTNILEQISAQAAQDPSVDPSLTQLITDLANKAHAVGDDDARLFALKNEGIAYFEAATFMKAKQAVESYLSSHPDALVPGVQQALNYATGEVTDHMAALIGAPPSATDDNANMVMSDKVQIAINEYTASQTHASANQICENGGQPPACIVPQ